MRILGEDMSDPRQAVEVKRRIGVVPENLALFDNLTAREYLTFIGRMYLLPAATVHKRCEELLAMMDLADAGKEAHARVFARHEKEARPGRRADSQSRPVVSGRTVRGRGCGGFAGVARHAQAMRRTGARPCS